MNRAIQYRVFGTPEVLDIVDAEPAEPSEGEVRVAVRAAGLNPVDWKIFSGSFGGDASRLSKGVANDFSGVIESVGAGVSEFAVGDAVLGSLRKAIAGSQPNGALAEHLVASAQDVVKKPEELSFVDAASLGIAALAASGALHALDLQPLDVIVISAASGGVGSMAVQLAVQQGATVIGIASESNADYVRSLGAIPVSYGSGLESRVRAAAGEPITKLLDCFGEEYVDLALALGLGEGSIATIVRADGSLDKGAIFTGSRDAQPGDLERAAELVANNAVTTSIARVYPLTAEAVREAYTALQAGHVRGKLVVQIA